MTKFSSRFGFDPRVPKEPILEDAPEWLRIAYINSILVPITYIDMDAYYTNDEHRPLGVKQLCLDFCGIARQEPDSEAFDSELCRDHLKELLKHTEWFRFYDFVEFVGQKLKKAEEADLWRPDGWESLFGFESFRQKVNQLFSEERIGWRLNEKSELVREIPKALANRITATSALLQDQLAPARGHYEKAVHFMVGRPTDPENAIKEITSAVESASRVYYRKANTLSDAVVMMKKQGSVPLLLISLVEKFYAYASSEPAVRHGAPVSSRVAYADAEFCFHVGTALIRYLVDKHSDQTAAAVAPRK